VCRSPTEALQATTDLLARTGAVVVKQAHNGAGVGNQLVTADAGLASGHVGARHLHHLGDTGGAAVAAYWAQRWDWASAGGRYPVVVEEFTDHTASVYSEHYANEAGTYPTQTGLLCYVGRRLSHQIVPLPEVDDAVRVQLVDGGTRLAQLYRAVGHRAGT
jgi:hypothetical protein